MTGTPGWAWAAAVGVILGLLAVDLAMGRGQPTVRRAVLVSAGWVAAAGAFGGVLLAGAMTWFAYLTQGLTALLAFIGVKMLLAGVLHIPATVSLGVIAAIIVTAVLLSARQRRRPARPTACPHDLHTGCAGPAPRPDVLDASTRQVATDGGYPNAVPTAEATARPDVTAVAK